MVSVTVGGMEMISVIMLIGLVITLVLLQWTNGVGTVGENFVYETISINW